MMDADIGIMNGGGIRKPIKAGDITLDNILSVFPWGNLPCKMEVTGQTVLDMLEMGAINYPEESGGFLSVSGLKYTIMAGVPSSIELTDKGEFSKVAGKYRVTNVQVLNKKTNEYEPAQPQQDPIRLAVSTTPSPTAATASRCLRTLRSSRPVMRP